MNEPKLTIRDWNKLYAMIEQRKLHLLENLFKEDDDNVRSIIEKRLVALDELGEKILDIFK